MKLRDRAAYKRSWLSAHPHRSEEWLDARLRDGFDLHHVDGDPTNNAAGNLVLIEASDHLALHNGGTIVINFNRLPRPLRSSPPAPRDIRDPIIIDAERQFANGAALDDNPHVAWGAAWKCWRRAFLRAQTASGSATE